MLLALTVPGELHDMTIYVSNKFITLSFLFVVMHTEILPQFTTKLKHTKCILMIENIVKKTYTKVNLYYFDLICRQIARYNELVNKDKSDYYNKLTLVSHDSRTLWFVLSKTLNRVSEVTRSPQSTVRFKRENPDLSLLDLKFRNMQGFGANMEISFMKYGSFMQKFAPFETFVKIMYVKKLKKPSEKQQIYTWKKGAP